MQILGFKPYHSYECLFVHGVPHMEVEYEAVVAQHNTFPGIIPKADFEKWFADYDVSLFYLLF
jgi:hypothetical protein